MAGKKFDITKFAATLGEAVPESGTTMELALGDIIDNPRNFYPRPDNKALAALMESIQANGLLEPPTVVPAEDGKYRLISGHSRMAALRLLAANQDEAVAKQFAAVLCRVLPAMTEEQELCAVIEANRQRVKSNALLAEEAEKLKETYLRRKQAGEKLPLGLREWVAREAGISPTKVGNLQVIKKGLKVPGILARWESGELPEAAALEIARMDDETQHRLLDWVIDNHRSYTIKDVQEFVKSRKKALEPISAHAPAPSAAPEWLPLDAAHWPEEGELVVLSYETGLGGSSYLVARCAGSADEAYPFISTDAGTTVDDIIECRCDRWMPLAECRRGEEGHEEVWTAAKARRSHFSAGTHFTLSRSAIRRSNGSAMSRR